MGVDTDAFRRDHPYIPRASDTPLRLFSCARLNLVKGHQDLMQAVRIMIDGGQPVTLDIAGEDDLGGTGYRRVLEALITELGLGDHVRLLGAISAEAVRSHLLKAHVFVLASWKEPLGVAYMEAMSCGVPTVGTDAGGVPELITDGKDGILVPPKNPEALARALLALACDPEHAQRIAQAGRARVVEAFDSSMGARMLIDEIWPDVPIKASAGMSKAASSQV